MNLLWDYYNAPGLYRPGDLIKETIIHDAVRPPPVPGPRFARFMATMIRKPCHCVRSGDAHGEHVHYRATSHGAISVPCP